MCRLEPVGLWGTSKHMRTPAAHLTLLTKMMPDAAKMFLIRRPEHFDKHIARLIACQAQQACHVEQHLGAIALLYKGLDLCRE